MINIDITNMSGNQIAKEVENVKSKWVDIGNLVYSRGDAVLNKGFDQMKSHGYYREKGGQKYLTYPNFTKENVSFILGLRSTIVNRLNQIGVTPKSITIMFGGAGKSTIGFKPPRA